MKDLGKSALLPYSHAVLFTELFDSELIHGGGHILDGLLQVLRVTLNQRLGDSTPAMLEGRKVWKETLKMAVCNKSLF